MATVMAGDLETIGPRAARIEAIGYDGLYTAETQHDPFFPLVLAAEHTERIDLATAIAVGFPRSPTHLAHIGHDLQRFSKGRFILGLGSQIKAHIEKRFSAQFSSPAARMRELILATRAIWRTWEEDEPLRFEGEFYRHTLMTPFFSPGPTGYGPPRVFLAAVGEKMTEVAGEVCDGMFVHGFTTEKYLRETTLPAIERGLAKSGRHEGRHRAVVPDLHHHRRDRRGVAESRRRRPGADRLLRLHPRLPARARGPRLGRGAGRAQRGCPSRGGGRRWGRSSPTTSSTPSPCGARPARCPA